MNTLGRIQTGTLGKDKSIYNDIFEKQTIAEFYRGSIAHNMFVGDPNNEFPSDDQDIMVIYNFPKQYYFTLEDFHRTQETFEEKHEDMDVVGYEIKKMFHLLAGLNPNTTPALYTRESDFTVLTPAWRHVMENKDVFVKRSLIREVYIGYATAQYRRMIDKKSWFGYMGAKRKALYEKLGYDAKYAAHSIRLMRMGTEFLTDGQPIIFRDKDREELLEIKEGKKSLEHIKELYGVELLNLEKAFRESLLPDKDTKHNVNKLLFEVMEMVLTSVNKKDTVKS